MAVKHFWDKLNGSEGDVIGTFNGNILPTATGLDLGAPAQRWDIYANNINATGTFPGQTIIDARQYQGATFDATLTSALAAVSATGGVIDCRGITGNLSFAANFTINKANTTILFGNCSVSMGTFQILISAGTHGVSLIGCVGSGSSAAAKGTVFSGTGASGVIVVGSFSADTFSFQMQDITIDIHLADTLLGSGIILLRAINYALYRPVIYGTITSSNTQKLIILQGTGNFTGGLIQWPYLNNGGYGIYMSDAANANVVIGGQIPCVSTGIGIYIADASANGNFIYGPDIENAAIALRCLGSYNFASFRAEGCTKVVQLDSGAHSNKIQSVPMSPSVITDNSANTTNSFESTGVSTPAWTGNGGFILRPFLDSEIDWIITPGNASNQVWQLIVRDKGSVNKFNLTVDASGNTAFGDGTLSRFLLTQSGNTSIQGSAGANGTRFGDAVGSGTDGIAVYSGGASPVVAATIPGTGLGTFNGGIKAGASGTTLTQIKVYAQALDVASVAANTSAEQDFTVTGLTTADKVFVNKPSLNAGLVIGNARVKSADTLSLTFGNLTGSPIDPGSETYQIVAIRS